MGIDAKNIDIVVLHADLSINFVETNVAMYLTLNTFSIVARDPGLSSLENLMVAGVGGSY